MQFGAYYITRFIESLKCLYFSSKTVFARSIWLLPVEEHNKSVEKAETAETLKISRMLRKREVDGLFEKNIVSCNQPW